MKATLAYEVLEALVERVKREMPHADEYAKGARFDELLAEYDAAQRRANDLTLAEQLNGMEQPN